MAERSWFWGGTSTGDAALAAPYGAPYTDDMFSDFFAMLLNYDRTVDGVVATNYAGFTGNLAATTSNSAVTVQSGLALVDGKLYANTTGSVLNYSGDGTWYVVLRKSWSLQTIRLTLTTTITQSDGVTWDLPLWQAVRSGGVVTTFTDIRNYLNRPSAKYLTASLSGSYPSTASYTPTQYYLRKSVSTDTVGCRFFLPDDYRSNLKVEFQILSLIGGNGNLRLIRQCDVYTPGLVYQQLVSTGYYASVLTYPGKMETAFITPGDSALDLRLYRGSMIQCEMQRDGTNVLDTATLDVIVIGAKVTYT